MVSTDGEFQFGSRWVELASGLSLPDDTVSSLEDRDHNLENFLSLHTATGWNDSVAGTGGPLAPVWVPVATQGVTLTGATNIYARWRRLGDTVTAAFRMSTTGTGTAANRVAVTLPVAYDTSSTDFVIGPGGIRFATGPLWYAGIWRTDTSGTTASFLVDRGTSWFGVNPAVTITGTVYFEGTFTYEVL